jgi:hypothetical protein
MYKEGYVHHCVYNNSPHVLVRLKCPPGTNDYVIVLGLWHDVGSLPHTITAFAQVPISIGAVQELYTDVTNIEKPVIYGSWTVNTCGGPKNSDDFHLNPQYLLRIKGPGLHKFMCKVGFFFCVCDIYTDYISSCARWGFERESVCDKCM